MNTDASIERERCRPFTILDGVILIAATAVGMALGVSWILAFAFQVTLEFFL
jgi:hypothetical protein